MMQNMHIVYIRGLGKRETQLPNISKQPPIEKRNDKAKKDRNNHLTVFPKS
jgi:hypothetical protein